MTAMIGWKSEQEVYVPRSHRAKDRPTEHCAMSFWWLWFGRMLSKRVISDPSCEVYSILPSHVSVLSQSWTLYMPYVTSHMMRQGSLPSMSHSRHIHAASWFSPQVVKCLCGYHLYAHLQSTSAPTYPTGMTPEHLCFNGYNLSNRRTGRAYSWPSSSHIASILDND